MRALWALVFVLVCQDSYAQDRSAWFKSLKQPGNGLSCCDVSDCRRTEAEWLDDGWVAVVNGVKRAIPPGKVLLTPHTLDGEAYVCAQNPVPSVSMDKLTIYCFIPPTMGF